MVLCGVWLPAKSYLYNSPTHTCPHGSRLFLADAARIELLTNCGEHIRQTTLTLVYGLSLFSALTDCIRTSQLF